MARAFGTRDHPPKIPGRDDAHAGRPFLSSWDTAAAVIWQDLEARTLLAHSPSKSLIRLRPVAVSSSERRIPEEARGGMRGGRKEGALLFLRMPDAARGLVLHVMSQTCH